MEGKNDSGKTYDVVIVGAGIAGAILAKVLGNAKKHVLILEAGRSTSFTVEGYRSFLETFYRASAKVPNSPYPNDPSAPQPDVLNIGRIEPGVPSASGYFVQRGPLPFASDYARTRGGTTLHWLGTCLRMTPNDFHMKSRYGQGENWPITYDELRPYYEQAELEIGVSADVDDQRFHGITFGKNYHYPMRRIPQSYLDHYLASRLEDFAVNMPGQAERIKLHFSSIPQGRNSIPNAGYRPVGHTGDNNIGQRCEGNSSCVPICPVQAKYNALKTLKKVDPDYVEIRSQAVASKIEIDPDSGRVTGITYNTYGAGAAPGPLTARGKIYVIAAHSIETAKLLLASQACRTSGEVGRNLMDHIEIIVWALAPEGDPIGAFRGPGATTNINSFRDGAFRARHSGFNVPIGNWGWSWSCFSPGSDLMDFIGRSQPVLGRDLRRRLYDRVSRQMELWFELEQNPCATNRVTIDPEYRDSMGNFRPVIHYGLSDYVRKAMPVARRISEQIFRRIGAKDYTHYNSTDPCYVTYRNQGFFYRGAGHVVGTHRMGSNRFESVVNDKQRTWDHDNLYLAGCGNMPTLGTSNPTLTMAALTFWAGENILKELNR